MGQTDAIDHFLERINNLECQLSIKEHMARLESHMSLVKDLHDAASRIETDVRWTLGQLAIVLSEVKLSAGQEDAKDAVLLDLELVTKNAAGDRCCPCQCHAKTEPAVSGDGTADWKPPEGSDMTVADMVKKAAQEVVDSSDYVFNEEYQMYYSVSTGCYYDPSTQLLYEPNSGTYYRYNAETGSYEVHSQVEPNTGSKARKSKCKDHAELRYSEDQGGYLLKDLGSQAGTSLNGVPLEQGQESLVQHMDRLQLGSVQLEAHIHRGTNTCTRCEPGLMDSTADQQAQQPRAPSPSSEAKRRAQLKKLKAKYGLKGMEYVAGNTAPGPYQDRAQERRVKVGSNFPHERDSEPASVDRPLSEDNVGFKMLHKMGWKEGTGLGKEKQGTVEPVKVSTKKSRTGLGHSGPKVEDKRSHILNKTRERYEAIAEKEAAGLSPKQDPA
ncbi:angiogenic factor with G patch and FHA domains 1 isoform X2 [Haemaphysalis longicornis]